MEENQKWEATKVGEERIRPPLRTNWRDLRGAVVCVAASLLFTGLFVWISELQSRIVHLEQQQDAQITAWMRSSEQVEPVLLGRLDRILEEVSAVVYLLIIFVCLFVCLRVYLLKACSKGLLY